MSTRTPPPDREVPEGYELVAVPEGPDWRTATGRRCRYGMPSCKRPAVAELNRGRRLRDGRKADSWWGYCDHPEHLFGRWIEDGQVMHWILRETADHGHYP